MYVFSHKFECFCTWHGIFLTIFIFCEYYLKKEGVILYLGGGGAKTLFVIFVYVGDLLE